MSLKIYEGKAQNVSFRIWMIFLVLTGGNVDSPSPHLPTIDTSTTTAHRKVREVVNRR